MTFYNNANNLVYSGYKNLVPNGALNVWQRATSFALVSVQQYTADRWFTAFGTSAAYTFSQQSLNSNGFQFVHRMQRPNGSSATTNCAISNPFETADSIPLQGQTVTLSFYARCGANYSPTSSNFTFVIVTGTGTDQAATALNGGTWTNQTNVLVQAVSLTTTLTRYSGTVTLASNVTQIAVVLSTNNFTGTAGASDYADVTGVQLEIGNVPTAFDVRPDEIDLYLCRRWFSKSFLYGTVPAQNAGTGTGEQIMLVDGAGTVTNGSNSIFLPSTMRGLPSVTLFNPANTNAQVRDETLAADCSSSILNSSGDRQLTFSWTGNASSAVGSIAGLHWTADASL